METYMYICLSTEKESNEMPDAISFHLRAGFFKSYC